MTKRFETKEQAQSYINEKGELAEYFTSSFVSDHYAPAMGLERGGWYILDSWNNFTN